jgi:uncharacterized membrane protein
MIKRIKACFAKEPVNLGRQRELDIAKGLAIIFMVFCHSFEILSGFFDPKISTDLAYLILDVILGGSFAAPAFMFCMGISFCYSRKNSAKDMLRRALSVAVVALLLEIFRTAIPGLLEWLIFRDPECIEYVYVFFEADILQFAALSMLVIALFKKLNLKPYVMVIIAVFCSVVGQLLQWVSTGSAVLDLFTGFIWHSHDYSFFPLLNWLIFPVCGYAFGGAWQRLQNKEAFFLRVTPISFGIAIAYFIPMAFIGEYYLSGGDYYGMGIGDAVFAFVICFAMIGLGYYLAKWGGRISDWLGSLGARVTSVYCIHWTIYCFLGLLLSCVLGDYISQWIIIPVSVVVLVASDLLSRLYVKIKTNKRQSK